MVKLFCIYINVNKKMKRKLLNKRKPPKGFDKIEPELIDLNEKLREAENEPSDTKRKTESIWPILRIHHQISRYIYQAYKDKEISKEVLNYCIEEKIADGQLIAKWKKPGFEKLCCLMCIQNKNHNFGTACICRVPKDSLEKGKRIECVHCGCRGCASCDI